MNFWQLISFPFAIMYGFVISIRNFLYNNNLLKSNSFDIPVISVGNLSMGGTGKTPHVEYLIRLLQKHSLKIAVLSRGYKRKTSGFIIADDNSTPESVGDESYQMQQKFDDIVVAVDEDRTRGIRKLTEVYPDLDVILLDDAFQHRRIKPGLSILLTDYHNLFTTDYIFPSGTLREPRKNYSRADIIVVTKTGKVLSPLTYRSLLDDIKPKSYQKLFFSYIKYDKPVPLTDVTLSPEDKKYSIILLVTGIANPYPLEYYLIKKCYQLEPFHFPDHYEYTKSDIKDIREAYVNLFSKNKVIYTTEKDAVKLKKTELIDSLKDLPVYIIPIKIEFHKPGKNDFDEIIVNFVKGYRKMS